MGQWFLNGISSAFDVVIVTSFYSQRLGLQHRKYDTYLISVILCAVMTTVSSVFTGTPLVPVSVCAAFICYSRFYPKIRVNHKRALSEISKLREHFDESRAYS